MRVSFLVIKDPLIRLFIFGILLLTNTFTEILLMTSFGTYLFKRKDYGTLQSGTYRVRAVLSPVL
jgi:hypothetical protein